MREIQLTSENASILKLVQKIDKFKGFSEQDIHSFLKAGKLREYQPKEVIIKEGGNDCWLYFLISGELKIQKNGQIIGTLRRCGDMFGEMGIIDGSPRSATILANSKSVLVGFDSAIIEEKLKANEMHFCYIIYRIFAEVLAVRLRETTASNVKFQKDNEILKKNLLSLKTHAPSSSPNQQLQTDSLAQKVILIVDGVEVTRKILRSLLREIRCRDIFEAADGESALKSLKTQEIDLVIADFDLPKMSGLDLLKKMGAIPELQDTPFVLIMNKSDRQKAECGVEGSTHKCLIKPYTTNMLHEKLAEIL